jgi:predicted adenine nucleotide alpha hydrolase (AANH) superfamily ATPase
MKSMCKEQCNITERKRLLLHSCCGPCSTAVIERLIGDWDLTVFYYNPNITDPAEYRHRKEEQIRFLWEFHEKTHCGVAFMEGDYEPESFFRVAEGLETEPEGGVRCAACFQLRLSRTAALARELGFDAFDTTLSVSPYKNYDVISKIGRGLEERYGVRYLAGNYKKKDGYRRSVELSRDYGLYRQHYCGCVFSERNT